ncbi:hypothetical protein COLO4_25210 [Corchorus olitorius]|uniref:DUF569 domain-containing protein n=1 Tax=Corchorus olitorius TaxID=93759 RepID=A0A1R3I4A0_9ROSI|nr:hypothetical protein COLO4_25210 [Corchorus olitorius]
MEFFHKAKAVRLRSHLGKYLVADEDEETVRQSRNGSSQRARWTVQFVQGDTHLIRLKSVYNKYLTATNEPFLLGMTGKKVMQAIPSSKHDSSIDWEPITDRNQVKLRTRSYGKFLRANGGTPPWRNSVTHDVPHRTATQDWILWEVDVVDILESSDFSSSIASSFSTFSTFSSNSDLPAVLVTDSFDEYAFRTQARSASAMEIFRKANAVRLRSHHDKYLLAEDDEESVCQDRDGTVKNAKWMVEIVDSNQSVVRLKGCYGKYLTASNMPCFLGMTGKKVSQSLPKRLDSSVEWEPIRDGVQVRLRTRYGQYLRANGGLPPWRNSVTHDVPHRTATQDWVLWDVDIVEFRKKDPAPAPPPAPVLSPSPPPVEIPQPIDRIDSDRSDPGSPSAISLRGPRMGRVESDDSFCSRVSFEGRVINYEVIDDDGNVDEAIGERTFTVKGSGVEELKQMLKEEAGVDEEVCICSRNPLNGQLYPLRLHLPPNNAAMNLVLVPLSSKG